MELEKVLAIDPVTNVEETYRMKEVVYKSNVNNSCYKYNADSFSNQNIIFNNITPPSLNTVIPRAFKLLYQLQVVVNSGANNTDTSSKALALNNVPTTGNGQFINLGTNNLVLADSPMQASCTAIELRINGSSTSISPNDYIMIYSHMAENDSLRKAVSVYPHQKDTAPIYNGATADLAINNYRSVFAPYGANTTIPSRASYTWSLTNRQAQTVSLPAIDTYLVTVEEDIYISPAVWGEFVDKCAGFTNINNFTMNFRIDNLLRAVRCQSAVSSGYPNGNLLATDAITITIPNQPQLDLLYITPDPVLAAKLPSVVSYDYSYLQPFITSAQGTTFATGQSQQINLNSVRLPSIPKRIMLYAKPSKSYLNQSLAHLSTTPDSFLRITGAQITFNNRINLLANDTEFRLYQRSRANGLTDSWEDWQYNTGSVLILDVAKDLGLESDECSGQSNKYSTLQVQLTVNNVPQVAWGATQNTGVNGVLQTAAYWDFYILVESPGKAFVTPSDCQFVLTGPSSAEVLALTGGMDKVVDHDDLKAKTVGGGAFSFGNLLKSGARMVKNVDPERVASGVKAVQGALGALGMGVAGGAMQKHKRVY